MTLRQALFRSGHISDINQTSMRCPFHNDNNPSASLRTNTMRCWSKCSRTYTLLDFQALLGPSFAITPAPEAPEEDETGADKVVMFYH